MDREINQNNEKNKIFYERMVQFSEYITNEINKINQLIVDLDEKLPLNLSDTQKSNLEQLCDSLNIKISFIDSEVENFGKGIHELEAKKTYLNSFSTIVKGPAFIAKNIYENNLRTYIEELYKLFNNIKKESIELKAKNKKYLALARSDVTMEVVRHEVDKHREENMGLENWVKENNENFFEELDKIHEEIENINKKLDSLQSCEKTVKMLVENTNKLKNVLEICLEENGDCHKQLEIYRRQLYDDINTVRINSENKMNYLENLANTKVVTRYV